MSQITRCPACHTVFRVVQDQLRMSDGWVRCGHCSEVFDAKTSLASSAAELSSIEMAMQIQAEPQEPAPLPAPPAFLAVADVAASAGDSAIARNEAGPIEPVLWPDRLPSARGSNAGLADVVEDVATPLPQTVLATNVPVSANPPQLRDAAVEAPVPPALADDEPPTAAAEVSFMRPTPGASLPESGIRRFLLAIVALALFAVLAAQVAVLERDRLAAMFPQFRPAVLWLCEQLGCTVASLRQIESVVIDSSSFNRARGDTYRLNLALRNTASVDVALPSVELTLTDSQDQALIRRVLSANELAKPGSTDGVLAAGAEWQGQTVMAVRMAANAERFTGYRVLVFYP